MNNEMKQKNTVDMTVGTPWKLIIAFAFPILFSQIFQQLYNSVDSIIVGNFEGKKALAAVASSGNLIFLFTSFFLGTSMGASIIISKYFGEKDYDKMNKAIHTNVAFGIVASIILTIIGVFLTPYMLKWMNTPEDVLPLSITYFRYYFLGISGNIMYNIFNSILRAVGNSKRPLFYLIFSSCLNVLLDLLFVAVFDLGVTGAAVATSLSQIISALLCLIFLMKSGTIYQLRIKDIKFHEGMLSKIIKYGVPAGIQNSVIAIANVFVQSNINSFGEDAMAACGTYSKIEGFAFLPINCFTMAITTFIGQNLGAKEYGRAKNGSRFGIVCSVILAELVGVLLYFYSPYIIKLFNDDANVIAIATKQFKTISIFYFLLSFSHCIAAVARGAGKAIVPMIIMLSIWCGIRVLYLSIIMGIRHEIVYVFWAYPLTWALSSIVFLLYYIFSDWVHGYENKKIKEEK